MLARLCEPRRGASVQGLLVRRLQHFHAFAVDVNGALMVRPGLAVWCGSRKEVWQPVYCHCRRQTEMQLGYLSKSTVKNVIFSDDFPNAMKLGMLCCHQHAAYH